MANNSLQSHFCSKTAQRLAYVVLTFILLTGILINPISPNNYSKEENKVYSESIDALQINAKIFLPRISQPAIVLQGDDFQVEVEAPADSLNWEASLYREYYCFSLIVSVCNYNGSTGRWSLNATVSGLVVPDLFNLRLNLTSDGQVVSLEEWNAVRVYESFPDSFTIVHLTDCHLTPDPSERDERLRYTLYQANLMNADLVIITGDLAEAATNTAYSKFKQILRSSEIPTFACPGNHDLHGPTYSIFFGPEYYTFSLGDLFCIMANTHDDAYFGASEIARIEQDLIDHSSAKFKMLAFHYPVWSLQHDEEEDIRRICYEQGVSLVIFGHSHNDRVEEDSGTLYVMTRPNGGNLPNSPHGDYWGYRIIQIDNYVLTSWSWKETPTRSLSQPIQYENGTLANIVDMERSPTDLHNVQPGLFFNITNYRDTPLLNQVIDAIVTPLGNDHYVVEGANLVYSVNGTDGWLLRMNCSISPQSSMTIRVYPSNPSAPTFVAASLPDPWSGWHLEFTANFTNSVSGINYAEMRYSINSGTWNKEKMICISTGQFYAILDPLYTGDVIQVQFKAYDYSGLGVDSQIYTLEIVPRNTISPIDTGLLLIYIVEAAILIAVVATIAAFWRHKKPN